MQAFIPADAITPANIGDTRQPARTAPFRIARRHTRGIKRFIEASLCMELLAQIQKERDQGLALLAQEPVELGAIGQGRKSSAQMMLRVPIEIALALKMAPLPEDCQRHHFTPCERRCRGSEGLRWQRVLAEIVDHDIQCGQKGVRVDHGLAPYCEVWLAS